MPNDDQVKHHARVARELDVNPKVLRDHPYELEMNDNGSLLVRWREQAPDGVIRDGKLGSYTTHIRAANAPTPSDYVEDIVRSQSG